MCVAALAWDAHPDWLLVMAGNRDEFHARPAAPLARWDQHDGQVILAGRDLTGGGTWLGVTDPAEAGKPGRFVLVTNYRRPEGPQPGRPSRGKLVSDILGGAPGDDPAGMNAFNLVAAQAGKGRLTATFLTNFPQVERRPLAPGYHGLSNGGFDAKWPKTLQLEKAIASWLEDGGRSGHLPLLQALRQDRPPLAAGLPDRPEERFAPVFICDPDYGTRCSTVVTVDRHGRGTITEQSYAPNGTATGTVSLKFTWPTA